MGKKNSEELWELPQGLATWLDPIQHGSRSRVPSQVLFEEFRALFSVGEVYLCFVYASETVQLKGLVMGCGAFCPVPASPTSHPRWSRVPSSAGAALQPWSFSRFASWRNKCPIPWKTWLCQECDRAGTAGKIRLYDLSALNMVLLAKTDTCALSNGNRVLYFT